MENSRPDQQPVQDAKSKEVFMHNWLRRFEKGEAEPASHHTLSGERWQTIFRNMYQRADAAPEKLDHTEQQYELRHEHKDVPADTGQHLGAVITGALGSESTELKTDNQPPATTGSINPAPQPSIQVPQPPAYQPMSSTRRLLSWVIVLVLVAAIIALLGLLF